MDRRKKTLLQITAAGVCACAAAMCLLQEFDERDFPSLWRMLQLNDEGNQYHVFYNLFVALPDDIPRVKGIVLEQFEQVANVMNKADFESANVHITNIGFPLDVSTDPELASLLPSNVHVTTEYLANGNEKQTLIKLWDHCKKHPGEGSIVTYLHSKGSFHSNPKNELLRSFLTRGAASEECIGAVLNNNADGDDTTCDVCSSRFSPLPHPHTSGNMWTARCSYVSQLHDPRTFENEMNKFYAQIEGPRVPGFIIGAGRFAYEHWVHCHPSVKPCDVYAHPTFLWGYPRKGQVPSKNDPFLMDLQPAPRFPFNVFLNEHSKMVQDVSMQLNLRLQEYAQIYDETPPDEWYGWAFHGQPKHEAVIEIPA